MVKYIIDPLSNVLYKGVYKNHHLKECYGWHCTKKQWEDSWSSACGLFMGFESGDEITKEEAMKITGGVE